MKKKPENFLQIRKKPTFALEVTFKNYNYGLRNFR